MAWWFPVSFAVRLKVRGQVKGQVKGHAGGQSWAAVMEEYRRCCNVEEGETKTKKRRREINRDTRENVSADGLWEGQVSGRCPAAKSVASTR